MRGLIYFPLLIITLFMVVATVGGGANFDYSTSLPTNGSLIVGNETTAVGGNGAFSFTITPLQGAITIAIAIITLGSIIGVRVMGSGFLGISAEIIIKGAFYLGLWGIFSVFAQPLISSIPLFGTVIYLILTLMYVIGFVQSLMGGLSNE